MLAGHSRLFAAPELQLLNFDTLAQRRAALVGRYSPWREDDPGGDGSGAL